MPTILTQLSTEPLTAERTWTVEDIPVLTASISLPAPAEGTGGGAARLYRQGSGGVLAEGPHRIQAVGAHGVGRAGAVVCHRFG